MTQELDPWRGQQKGHLLWEKKLNGTISKRKDFEIEETRRLLLDRRTDLLLLDLRHSLWERTRIHEEETRNTPPLYHSHSGEGSVNRVQHQSVMGHSYQTIVRGYASKLPQGILHTTTTVVAGSRLDQQHSQRTRMALMLRCRKPTEPGTQRIRMHIHSHAILAMGTQCHSILPQYIVHHHHHQIRMDGLFTEHTRGKGCYDRVMMGPRIDMDRRSERKTLASLMGALVCTSSSNALWQ